VDKVLWGLTRGFKQYEHKSLFCGETNYETFNTGLPSVLISVAFR